MPLQQTSGNATVDAYGGGAAAVPNYIEDVFSTYLYTGNGSTQTITNGIDLSGKGGLVWIKNRTSSGDHYLFDTVRGVDKALQTDTTAAELSVAGNGVNPFNANGFGVNGNIRINVTSNNFASWTFREQPKFFDVVTFTQPGIASGFLTVNHSLGSTPGCIIIKRTSAAQNWLVYHKDTASQYLYLNLTDAAAAGVVCQNVTSTSFDFNLGAFGGSAGTTYVAYLFAHNAGGFGLTGTDNVISCGITDSGGNATLGYEPQWILAKTPDQVDNWKIIDTMRGWRNGSTDNYLFANTSGAEGTNGGLGHPTATGFTLEGGTHIYIAIRRGPMKVPTDGTTVFSPNAIGAVSAGTPVITGFPVDLQIATWRGGASSHYFYDRLRGVSSTTTEGAKSLLSDSTAAETSPTTATRMWGNTGYQVDTSWSNSVSIFHNFRRAPGFFDEVCYTGTGAARTISHNLGVAPELIITKQRSAAGEGWGTGTQFGTTYQYLLLNSTAAATTRTAAGDNFYRTVSSTSYDIGIAATLNASGATYVAYLFASCPGVSKVGSYTGNGSTQTINCGFTGGARFVLIKRTDSTGDWYVYDTARGMTTLTDPYLLMNSTAAESATLGSVTTVTTGFALNASILAAINTNGASYIFLAIA